MDKCHYCGAEYHPMPVYTHKAKPRIRVCHHRFDITDDDLKITEVDECKQKAKADGYVFRPDLTPKQ